MNEPQYVEEPCAYAYQVVLTAGQALKNQPVTIDADSDFLLTGVNGSSTGTFNVNFSLPNNGRQIANTLVKNVNLISTSAAAPTAIGPSPVYPKGSVLKVDITDTSGAGNTVEVIFSGIRRFRVN